MAVEIAHELVHELRTRGRPRLHPVPRQLFEYLRPVSEHVQECARRVGADDTCVISPDPSCTLLHVFRYRPEILEQLARHGVQPRPTTRPELVHEFVSDLYRHELRRLRDRLVRREIPKLGYYDRVVELRRKYPIVSLKPHQLCD